MRDHQHIGELSHVHDFSGDGEAAATGEIRLQDIHFALFNQLPETPLRGLLLATRDQGIYALSDLAVTVVILGMQNLFDKERPEGLDGAHNLNCLLRRAFDEPAGVHEQVVLRAHLLAGPPPPADVEVRVFSPHPPAEPDRCESLFEILLLSFPHGPRRLTKKPAGTSTPFFPPFSP